MDKTNSVTFQSQPQSRYALISPATSRSDPRSSGDDVGAKPGRKTKRIACISCRQAKLKCEGLEKASTCARCKRMSIPCTVDSGFKRENKRRKLDDLTEELNQLRSIVYTSQTSNPSENLASPDPRETTSSPVDMRNASSDLSPVAPTILSQTMQGELDQSDLRSYQTSSVDNVLSPEGDLPYRFRDTYTQQYDLKASQSRVFDRITVTEEQISALFKIFFENYHPFIPILNAQMSPDEFFTRSRLLFWTITVIGARRFEDDVAIYHNLVTGIQKLVWAKLSSSPHAHYTIQAVILLCNWPFPTASVTTDPCFMLISMAKTAAMQLGLHRPEVLQDYLRVKCQLNAEEMVEAVKLWAGCFITAESITTTEGQKSLFNGVDSTIELINSPTNHYRLPLNLRHSVLIHKFLNKIDQLIGSFGDHSRGNNHKDNNCDLISSLETDFDALEQEVIENISAQNFLALRCAQVHLMMYYLFVPVHEPRRKIGLLRACKAIEQYIHAANMADQHWRFAEFSPRFFGKMLPSSAILIARVVNSEYGNLVDFKNYKKVFNTAIKIQKRMSIESNDYNARAPSMLAQLWSAYVTTRNKPKHPQTRLSTRRGASILYDATWEWREAHAVQHGADVRLSRPPRVPPSLVLQKSSRHTPEDSENEQQDKQPRGRPQSHTQLLDEDRQTNPISDTAQYSTEDIEMSNLPEVQQELIGNFVEATNGTSGINALPPPWDNFTGDLSFMSYPDWMWDSGYPANGDFDI